MLVFAFSAQACAGSLDSIKDRDRLFERAVKSSLDQSWERAAAAAYAVTRSTSVDEERHDRSLLLLARAAEELGLRYAASLWYLEVASARRHVELLPKALSGIERLAQRGAHDHFTLVDGYVASADIGSLDGPRSDYVLFTQGLDSLRQGRVEWAEQSFRSIQDGSPYRFKADFVRAVHLLATGRQEQARPLLEAVEAAEDAPSDARDEAALALARLAMEQRDYADATERYERLRHLAPQRPELLLEMAWAHYYQGRVRRALGLLVALDAPVYAGLIAPERYLLEALCLRQLCQFEQARVAASRLRRAHPVAFEDLYEGRNPATSQALRDAARRRGVARTAARYRVRLELERQHAETLRRALGGELTQRLRSIYSDGITEAQRREDAALRSETLRLSRELLAAEDGVRIVLHELSVGLLRGRRRSDQTSAPPPLALDAGPDKIAYSFASEFWTDEIDDLVVTVGDRCLQ